MAKVMFFATALTVALAATVIEAYPVFTRSVRDGVYTTAQAERGQALYASHCARCHQSDLSGREDPTGATARSPWTATPALRGRTFISNWTDQSVKDLFERIRVSMPQDAPGSLPRRANADMLAFILQQNGFAIGLDELSSVDADLVPIRIEP